MTISPNSDLACLKEGTLCLARRAWTFLALSTLGMVLSALAPFIQMRAGLPDDLMTSSAVMFVLVFPLELYFIPRLLIELDAQAGGNPLNAVTDWKVHFEARWARAFLAKMLLGLVAGVGLACLVLPGLLTILAFGWVPLRVLLLGESLGEAARGSLKTMTVAWRRMLLSASAIALIYLTLGLAVSYLVALVVPEPTLWQRIAHPALWAGNFVASLLSIWLSVCFLSLFRRLEQAPPVPNPEA